MFPIVSYRRETRRYFDALRIRKLAEESDKFLAFLNEKISRNMLRIKLTPSTTRAKRRAYSPSALIRAYQAVKEEGLPVFRAAKNYGVPLTTLRDRIDNRVSADCTKPGPEPILSQIEEAKLVKHIKELASVGYGYTRAEVLAMASDFAVYLGKKGKEEKCFSMQWFYSFMGRWPELHVVKPSSLSEQRARCASEESICNYFQELDSILTKYELKEQPHLIYNIDEKGINTEYKPPNVVAGKGYNPQVVVGERSKTVTIIGAGNALGSQIPPFFVFPGQRMLPELMSGKSAGAAGTVTPSGWSNAAVFRTYMQEHFVKYVQGRDPLQKILVLYDGHKSHISLDLIDWARDNNIILFVLPPHCSHILQPMDVGCFGPLQLTYSHECLAFSRLHHRTVTRYDVCALACKAYASALSPVNLQAAFSKAGIYPLKPVSEVLEDVRDKVAPSTLYHDEPSTRSSIPSSHQDNVIHPDKETKDSGCFFDDKGGEVGRKVAIKKRRNISKVVGGKAVTETDILDKMKDYISESKSSKRPRKEPRRISEINTTKHPIRPSTSQKEKTPGEAPVCVMQSPQPGPSHINLVPSSDDSSSDEETESQIPLSDKCCVCKKFYVKSTNVHRISITNWAQCDICSHWVHLKFCTPVHVVRKNTPFTCPCC